MGIFLRFLWRNIRERRLRTLLIVTGIALSSALYLGTIGMASTLEGMFGARLRQYFGTAEIAIGPQENSDSPYFRPAYFSDYAHRMEYIHGAIRSKAMLKHEDEIVDLDLIAFNFEDLQQMNPVTFASSAGVEPFAGNKAIVGEHTARAFNLSQGDQIVLDIREHPRRFRLVGIAESTGFFTDDGRSHMVIIPLSKAAPLFDARGRISIAYAKTKAGENVLALVEEMTERFGRFQVTETVTKEQIREWTQETTIPFKIMLVLVVGITIFIIFTCFQVITRERLPIIGTFRSVGATRRTTSLVIYGESVVYGIIGGAVGCVLGIGVMYLMTRLNTSGWLSQTGIKLNVSSNQFIQAFVLAVGLSFLSAAIPVLRVSRIPVKDIILSTYTRHIHTGSVKTLLGVLFVILALLLPRIAPKDLALVLDTAAIAFLLTGVVLLMPHLVRLFVRFFSLTYQLLFGNIGILAAKNLRDEAAMLNNISLLAIGIASLFMINTISTSAIIHITRFYQDARFDVMMWTWGADRKIEQRLRSVEGVSDTLCLYATYETKIKNTDTTIGIMHGVASTSFFSYWDYSVSEDIDQMVNLLQQDRTILVTRALKRLLDIDIGDELVLQFKKADRSYRVVGFFDSLMWNGSYGLVGERYLKQDARTRFYDDIYIRTNRSPDTVLDTIKGEFRRRRPWLMTLADAKVREVEANQQMFLVLRSFAAMTLLIGIVGVINNFLVSFLERKRSLALLRSVGMSKKQTIQMLLIEAFSGGVMGSIAGVGSGFLMFFIVPEILRALDLSIKIFYSWSVGGGLFLIGVLVTLFASVGPSLKSSRLNIIESIKYE